MLLAVVAGDLRDIAAATEKAAREIGRRVVDVQTISTESAAAMNQMIEHVHAGISATRPEGDTVCTTSLCSIYSLTCKGAGLFFPLK
jgi:methyl-accepting chemotaxis protein